MLEVDLLIINISKNFVIDNLLYTLYKSLFTYPKQFLDKIFFGYINISYDDIYIFT